jgi:hypothetical protein
MSGETTYPWLRLLELEFEEEPKPVKRKRPGRPKNPFPRKRVRASLTRDEKAALDELVAVLSERMGRKISRGHLIAFLAFRLRSQLQREGKYEIGEGVDSFVSLARYLDMHTHR